MAVAVELSAYRAAADRLDNAYSCFAHDNGDGFGSYDWQGAYDYREEGYALGERAFLISDDERETFLDNEADDYSDSTRDLVFAAANFRLAELEREASRQAVVSKASMFMQGIAA